MKHALPVLIKEDCCDNLSSTQILGWNCHNCLDFGSNEDIDEENRRIRVPKQHFSIFYFPDLINFILFN